MLKEFLKNIIKSCLPLIDFVLLPLTFIAAIYLKLLRRLGVHRLPLARTTFNGVGVFPIRDHYYEPLFNPKHLRKSLNDDRDLPGIDFNISEQLDLLSKFKYNSELEAIPLDKTNKLQFYYNNDSFLSGDAEFLYNVIRHFKPKKLIEIGSGMSTLMAASAIQQNNSESSTYNCEHICIEPYEKDWLTEIDVKLERKLVENIDKNLFSSLSENDILFIDSSHIIRPQGDVLFEYLEILPILNKGVIVHIHDIFTPKDYPNDWVIDKVYLWNEQYLLEAFLSGNSNFKIIGALNFLKHHYPEELSNCCPILKQQIKNREPGSFWIEKN
ncbi:MAG: class I SAM-dependent methyltransferase [Prochloraceae cyanobacterium]|nr:class I SAM-dependent methyltransferase [Prochloraceae cyanobacterium]